MSFESMMQVPMSTVFAASPVKDVQQSYVPQMPQVMAQTQPQPQPHFMQMTMMQAMKPQQAAMPPAPVFTFPAEPATPTVVDLSLASDAQAERKRRLADRRPCEHNQWDNVRIKAGVSTLRCRECQKQWRVHHSGFVRCRAFTDGECEDAHCPELHIFRYKETLVERRRRFGDTVLAGVPVEIQRQTVHSSDKGTSDMSSMCDESFSATEENRTVPSLPPTPTSSEASGRMDLAQQLAAATLAVADTAPLSPPLAPASVAPAPVPAATHEQLENLAVMLASFHTALRSPAVSD